MDRALQKTNAIALVALVLPAAVGFTMAIQCPHDACDAPKARNQPAPATFRNVWILTYIALGLVGADLVRASDQKNAVRPRALTLWVALIAAEALWVHTWGCQCDPRAARTLLAAILLVAVALAVALAVDARAHKLCVAAVALHCAWLAYALSLNQDVVDQMTA